MAVTRVSRTAHGVRTSVCKRVTAPLFSRYEGVCFKFGVPNGSSKRLLYRNNENLRLILYSPRVQTFVVRWQLYSFFWVIPRRKNFKCGRIGTLCSTFTGCVNKIYEAGTDRVFQKVGTYNCDPGESPKRKNTTYLHNKCHHLKLDPHCCSLISPVPLARFHGVARIRYGGKAWYLVHYRWCTTPPRTPTRHEYCAYVVDYNMLSAAHTMWVPVCGGEVHSRGSGAFTASVPSPPPTPTPPLTNPPPPNHAVTPRETPLKMPINMYAKRAYGLCNPVNSGDRRAQVVDWTACWLEDTGFDYREG